MNYYDEIGVGRARRTKWNNYILPQFSTLRRRCHISSLRLLAFSSLHVSAESLHVDCGVWTLDQIYQHTHTHTPIKTFFARIPGSRVHREVRTRKMNGRKVSKLWPCAMPLAHVTRDRRSNAESIHIKNFFSSRHRCLCYYCCCLRCWAELSYLFSPFTHTHVRWVPEIHAMMFGLFGTFVWTRQANTKHTLRPAKLAIADLRRLDAEKTARHQSPCAHSLCSLVSTCICHRVHTHTHERDIHLLQPRINNKISLWRSKNQKLCCTFSLCIICVKHTHITAIWATRTGHHSPSLTIE